VYVRNPFSTLYNQQLNQEFYFITIVGVFPNKKRRELLPNKKWRKPNSDSLRKFNLLYHIVKKKTSKFMYLTCKEQWIS
jgi:hypothetical protein